MDFQLVSAVQAAGASGVARSAAAGLVAGLWQGMVLCAAAGLILKLVPKSTATLRFVVWAAVFGVSVALPFANLPGAESARRVGGGAASYVLLDMRWSYILAGLWLVAAACRMGQLAIQGYGLRMLWLTAAPVSGAASAGLDVQLSAAGRMVELCTSDEVNRPSVIGFFAPKILIPSWLFKHLTAVELNHIVLHELEHLRRRDDWVNLLQKVGLVLLPLNPALFWIDRRLSTERELACDDGVLQRTKMPKAYAASLASIAERRLDVRRHGYFGALALAATGLRRRSELGMRIESILERKTPINHAVMSGIAGLFVAGVIGVGVGLAHAPQVVSFQAKTVSIQAAIRPAEVVPAPLPPEARSTLVAIGAPKFQSASFRKPATARGRTIRAVGPKVEPVTRTQQIPQDSAATPKQRLFVLTSWEGSPVSRVVVQTPDGRFFLAPYAAVPTQAGWLFVQL